MPGIPTQKLAAVCAVLALAVVAVACGGTRTDEVGSYNDPQSGLVVLSDQQGLVVFSLARDLGVGPNRIPLTILRFDKSQVLDRASDMTVTYGLLNEDSARTAEEVTWRAWPFSGGAYTFLAEFDAAGTWEIAVTLDDPDGEVTGTAAILVREEPLAPGVGDPAPRTPTKTASSVDEVREISSDPDPRPEFYRVSLDEAIGSGKPVAVTFSTPAFCQTQACGPQLDTLAEVQAEYADRMPLRPRGDMGQPAGDARGGRLGSWCPVAGGGRLGPAYRAVDVSHRRGRERVRQVRGVRYA